MVAQHACMMKSHSRPDPVISRHDYGPALQSAVSWLGERYLLADPVPRRNPERTAFFNVPRSWHPQSPRIISRSAYR